MNFFKNLWTKLFGKKTQEENLIEPETTEIALAEDFEKTKEVEVKAEVEVAKEASQENVEAKPSEDNKEASAKEDEEVAIKDVTKDADDEKLAEAKRIRESIEREDTDEIEEMTQEQEINKEESKETRQRAILIKPKESREAKIIAKRLMENNIVVLNLKSVSEIDFERIRDFVSGTLFSLDGDYRKISASIAVLLPSKKVDEEYLKLVLDKAKSM